MPKPEVHFDQIDPDERGTAVLWFRSREDAKRGREQVPARQSDAAKLFVYEVREQRIVREIEPLAKARTTGLITEVAPGRLLGLTSGLTCAFVEGTNGNAFDVPSRTAVGKPLTALSTPDEFEPATFCLLARRELGNVIVELSDFVGEAGQGRIARENVSVGTVRCWSQRVSGWDGNGEYQVVPEMIEPPVGSLWGPERRGRNLPAEIDRLAQADIADYRAHGFDLVLLNYYFGVKENSDGSFAYSLSTLPEDLERFKGPGSGAPVVICFEYTCRNWEYQFHLRLRAAPGQACRCANLRVRALRSGQGSAGDEAGLPILVVRERDVVWPQHAGLA